MALVVSSAVVTDWAFATGTSLTGVTVSTTVSLAVPLPSFTVTLMVVVPFTSHYELSAFFLSSKR
jgi:hypothetical protein